MWDCVMSTRTEVNGLDCLFTCTYRSLRYVQLCLSLCLVLVGKVPTRPGAQFERAQRYTVRRCAQISMTLSLFYQSAGVSTDAITPRVFNICEVRLMLVHFSYNGSDRRAHVLAHVADSGHASRMSRGHGFGGSGPVLSRIRSQSHCAAPACAGSSLAL